MTYEKFEYKVLGMLLEGNDPRLERLLAQTWDSEVLSRDETEMGFNVKYLAPAPLAINESEGRIFGVEVKLSENEIINLELVIKDGLIDRLKGTFTSEMSYADLVKRYNDLTFSYKNENSSEVSFLSDQREDSEVTFVKNIATISKEIDANISKGPETTKEEAKTTDQELVEEPFTLALDEEEASEEAEIEVDAEIFSSPEIIDESQDAHEPFTLDSSNEVTDEIKQDIHPEEKDIQPLKETKDSEEVNEEIRIPEETAVLEEVALPKSSETIEESPDVAEESTVPVIEEDNLMMPPSFSIPKVPEAIQKNWTMEEAPLLSETLQEEKPRNISIKNTATSADLVKDFGLADILDGKAPQGPVSFSENLETKDVLEVKDVKIEEDISITTPLEEDQQSEFKNLTLKELSDPDLEIENPIEIDPQELESAALSAVDIDEVHRSIALMEKRNRELRIVTILIVLVTIVTIGFILSMIVSS